MAHVWGYARGSVLSDFASVDAQTRAIQEYVAAYFSDHEFMGVTVDDWICARHTQLLNRPNAAALNDSMQMGDILIVARLDRAFRTIYDLAHCLTIWRDRGIVLHVINFGGDVLRIMGEDTIRQLVEWERLVIHERKKETPAMQERLYGVGMGSTKRGWGFKWVNAGVSTISGKMKRKRVRYPKERAVMAEIVALVDQNWTWREIEAQFKKERRKVLKPGGRGWGPWTWIRVQAAYRAELKFREEASSSTHTEPAPPPEAASSPQSSVPDVQHSVHQEEG